MEGDWIEEERWAIVVDILWGFGLCINKIMNHLVVEQLSQAVAYFNSFTLDKLDLKLFQQHLDSVQRFLALLSNSQDCPESFISNIFTILVSKYYQIFTQNLRIITEQYLENKYAGIVKQMYEQQVAKGKVNRNIFALCLAANINKLKGEIAENPKNNQTVITLLQFNLVLLREVVRKEDVKVKEFYPKTMSLLSNAIRKQGLGIKAFEIVLETMKEMINSNECFKGSENDAFVKECHRRLSEDLEYLINHYHQFAANFKAKMKNFAEFLMKFYRPRFANPILDISQLSNTQANMSTLQSKLFFNVSLLAQMSEIPIDLESYQFLHKETIKQSYRQLFILTCRKVLKAEVNLQLKKQELNKLVYLIGYIDLKQSDSDEATKVFEELTRHLFHISKNHHLITIPHHASTIPLDTLQPEHTKANYPVQGLSLEYQKQFRRMVTEIVPFYELETQLVQVIKRLYEKISNESRLTLMRHFNDCLLENEYQINMSLTKLYSHLSLLLSLKYIVAIAPQSFQWYNTAYSIFETLGSKTESVKSLKASYIEEELLISTTIELICESYYCLKKHYLDQANIASKVRLTQSTIILFEKILNSLSEESYLIRLITTGSLLNFATDKSICKALQPIQSALIHRNKNNLELMLNTLTLAVLNPADYQELAEYYMNHRNSQTILRNLLPKISIQSCRKCILTVQKWWLLFNKETIEYLNCKEMKSSNQKGDNFYVKDGENVTIKNALGVNILQLAQKWTFYLRSQKRQVIVDIILEMSKVNTEMVFFRSFFSKILKEFISIIRECLGYEQQVITMPSKKKKESEHKVPAAVQKNDFYDRLRLKIYEVLTNLPKDSYIIYEKDVLKSLTQVFEPQHDQVKKDYLFNNNTKLKQEYTLGKAILQRLQND